MPTQGPASGGSPRPASGGLGAAAVDTAQVQRRIASGCPAGQAIGTVNQDGSVMCVSSSGGGTITGVSAGTGLTGGGSSGAVTLNVDFAGTGSANTAARSDHTHGNVQFQVRGHTTQSIPNAAPVAITSWSNVLYNDGGGTFTPGTGTYTVPVTGLYSVSVTVYWTPFTTTLGQGIVIQRNGVDQIVNVFGGTNATTSEYGSVQHVSSVYKLTAGDTVRVLAFQGSGASRNLAGTDVSSNFSVTLIR